MLRTQALCRPSSQQNRQQRLSPRRQIRNLNFFPSTKKTTEYSFELFLSIGKIVFDFSLRSKRFRRVFRRFEAVLRSPQFLRRQKAKNASNGQKTLRKRLLRRLFWLLLYLLKRRIQHRVISSACHRILVPLWCGRTYGHVTITSLPKFVGLIGYQICLAIVLRYCLS